MTLESINTLLGEAIKTTLIISMPLLIVVLIIGLVISIFQAITQINEQTLSFVPKIFSVFSVLIFLGPWMLNTMINYIKDLFKILPIVINT
ncbi:flagellar biosynthesis protein FliQ [Buchnera aphidicola (Ceratoglyphina bambusae)]|uniref:flagellar biosynthesis protein FliQ n=1 Tax=Buchnera aphidicola TaxID=9 RepID=UPI0031B8463B